LVQLVERHYLLPSVKTTAVGLQLGLKHVVRKWPTRAFCATRETFWEFSSNWYI